MGTCTCRVVVVESSTCMASWAVEVVGTCTCRLEEEVVETCICMVVVVESGTCMAS